MNGDMHCAFRLPVRFWMRCLSCVGQQWSNFPRYSPSDYPWTKHKCRMHGTYQECADGDCSKWHHWQLWDKSILSILSISRGLWGSKRLLDPGLQPGRRSSGLLLLKTVCEERRAMTSLTHAA